MSRGRAPGSGFSRPAPHRGSKGDDNQGLPSRPFSLPPGYLERYGVPIPQPAPGETRTPRPGLTRGWSPPRGYLEYYGISPPVPAEAPPNHSAPTHPIRPADSPLPHHAEAIIGSGPGASAAVPYRAEMEAALGRTSATSGCTWGIPQHNAVSSHSTHGRRPMGKR
jgi:hypothetical protein